MSEEDWSAFTDDLMALLYKYKVLGKGLAVRPFAELLAVHFQMFRISVELISRAAKELQADREPSSL